MSLQPTQQFRNLLKNAKQVLIFSANNGGGDAVGSAWAMYFFLKKMGMDPTVVAPQTKSELERFSFLPLPEQLMEGLTAARDFVLSFNTKFNKITNFRTERDENELRIFITPEKGSIDPRDFSFIPAKFKYDLVIVLGSPDKESLGKVYEENPDIFYEVPVINIDHHTENDNFGQVNIVDIKASSTCEVLSDIFLELDKNLLDEVVAECLLSGIIDETNSFQKKNTTPKSLHDASLLMTKGADQQKIIRYLYKTQPFHLLKLWGRIMARLNWEEDIQLVWAPIFLDDFVQSRSNPSDIPFILEKIRENYSAGKLFMVLYNETQGEVYGMIKSHLSGEHISKIAELVGGKVTGELCEFRMSSIDVNETGREVMEKIRAFEKKIETE